MFITRLNKSLKVSSVTVFSNVLTEERLKQNSALEKHCFIVSKVTMFHAPAVSK